MTQRRKIRPASGAESTSILELCGGWRNSVDHRRTFLKVHVVAPPVASLLVLVRRRRSLYLSHSLSRGAAHCLVASMLDLVVGRSVGVPYPSERKQKSLASQLLQLQCACARAAMVPAAVLSPQPLVVSITPWPHERLER
eukprot:scaffold10089_cov110-Isochrysis_galbana.AAC.6